jgi:alpha-glucosidase
MHAREALWWQNGVVYEIYPRSFADSNRDGVGDLEGIRRRLDYLAWLGIDAIWVAPFYPSPMADFGYDVADHTDVDPLFGDLATFDALLAAAHERGLRVIIDYVPNHTSDRHPWFGASRSSRDDPKRDWYIWRDPKPDGTPPNNWISMFGGPAWELDELTGQYYLHTFLPEQPDLDWRNPAVRDAMFDVARFWLARGVDGFRIDVAQLIGKDAELRDNPPHPNPAELAHLGTWSQQLHVFDQGHPHLHEVYRAFRRLLDSYDDDRPRVSIGELHHPELERWASYYGEQLDEIHLPFNFHLLRAPWEAGRVRAVIDGVQAALPEGAWANWVLGNHDQPRIASRVGAAQARVAMLLLLTLRGAPTLYYGEEIGMTNVPISPDDSRDPWERNVPGQGRDPQRSPMQWDAGPNAGFCDADIRPWLPLAPDAHRVNVAAQAEDPASMLSFTRRLLSLRRTRPALAIGDHRPVNDVPDGCLAYLRSADDDRLLVALNLTTRPHLLRLPSRAGIVVAGTHGDRDGAAVRGTLDLRADEAVIVEVPERE